MNGLTKQERGDLVAWMRLSTAHAGLEKFCSEKFGEPKNPNYKLCKSNNWDKREEYKEIYNKDPKRLGQDCTRDTIKKNIYDMVSN